MERHGNCPAFRCMYHGWTFDLEGHLTGVPYPEAYGDDFEKSDFDIPQLHVESFASLIFVAINPLVDQLVDFLGEVAPWVQRYCQNEKGSSCSARCAGATTATGSSGTKTSPTTTTRSSSTRRLAKAIAASRSRAGTTRSTTVTGCCSSTSSQRRVDRQQAQFTRALGREIKFAGPPPSNEVVAPQLEAPSYDAPVLGNGILTVFPTLDISPSSGRRPGAGAADRAADGRRLDDRRSLVGGREGHAAGGPATPPQQRTGVGPADFISADDNEAVGRCQIGAMASGVPFSNMARGRAPGKEGAKRDEYSLRSFYRGWQMYMAE